MTDTLPHLLTCIAMTILSMPLIYGWLLDICLGDPAWLPHPVVYFGKAIAWGEHRWNAGSHRKMKGAVMSLLLVAGVFALTAALLWLATSVHPLLAIVIKAVLIFFCLAGTTLIREVRQVFIALDESLDAGRRQVARIVGRDTSQLSAQEVRTAALETLAENLSDGVIAPLFWLAILGVPGMMAYKMVNTLDSMIGYHTERYLDFGCFGAHGHHGGSLAIVPICQEVRPPACQSQQRVARGRIGRHTRLPLRRSPLLFRRILL